MHFPYLALAKIASAIVGSALIGIALFVTETEEGMIQSRLEELWVRIDDRRTAGENRAVALLQESARAVGLLLNTIFGGDVFSIRLVVMSSLLSIVSMCAARELNLNGHVGRRPEYVHLVCAILLVFALLPAFVKGRWPLRVSAAFLVFIVVFTAWAEWEVDPREENAIVAWLLFNFAWDIAYLVLIRLMLKIIAENRRYIVGAFLVIAILTLLALIPIAVPLGLQSLRQGLRTSRIGYVESSFVMSLECNLVGGITSFLLFACIVLALVHRVAWSFLSRPVYALCRYKVMSNHKLLFTVGSLLLAYAISELTWLEKLK